MNDKQALGLKLVFGLAPLGLNYFKFSCKKVATISKRGQLHRSSFIVHRSSFIVHHLPSMIPQKSNTREVIVGISAAPFVGRDHGEQVLTVGFALVEVVNMMDDGLEWNV